MKAMWAVFIIGLSIPAVAETSSSSGSEINVANLKRLIEKSGLSEKSLGLSIRSMNEPTKIFFDHSGDVKLIPASLSKIFTAGAILANYPVGHKFVTELRLDGDDLCLKGGGDPGFVSETMWYLVNEFTRAKIKSLKGSIRVDNSRFDNNYFDSSRMAQRVDRAYDSPVSAMSFNWNSVNFYVQPGAKVGDPAGVIADPEGSYVKIVNKSKTGSGSQDSIQIRSQGVSKEEGTEQFLVEGTFGKNKDEKVYFRPIEDPTLWSGSNLKTFLAQRGIEVKGSVVKGVCRDSSRVVAKAESRAVHTLVADMLKFSNNYIAEMLSKNLAFDQTKKSGSIGAAMTFVKQWLIKDFSFNSSAFNFVNPSGLTNDNEFRVNDISRFLAEYPQKYNQSPEFISAFPVMGRDGTVKSRLKDTKAQDWVRAKTGLLTGAVGLAGYIFRPGRSPMTFAFVYNGSPSGMDRAKQVFDKAILEAVGQ